MATITSAVGAAGNWTSGGAWIGGIAPTAADDVILQATTTSMTIDAGAVCRSLTDTAFTGTLTHTAGVTLTIGDGTAGAGNVALAFGAFTYTLGDAATSAIKFVSTSSTVQTVNFNGKTTGNITFDGVGGKWQLTGTHNTGATAIVTLTNGTLDTNGQTCSWGTIITQTGTKTLTLGASPIGITATSGTSWNIGNSTTNLTFNANTSTITLVSGGAFNGGGLTHNNLTITGQALVNFSGVNTFNNITWVATSGGFGTMVLIANQTVTGTLTLTGVDSATIAGYTYVCSTGFPSVPSAPRTITAAAVSLTNIVFSDIVGAGAATWTGTRIGDAGGNSGITFDSPRTIYWVSTATAFYTLNRWATASAGTGGSASAPLPQDICVFDSGSITSAGGSMTFARVTPALDFTNAANAFTFNNGLSPMSVYGNLILKTGSSTTAGTGTIAVIGRGSHTINLNGVTLNSTSGTVLQISALGGTYTLQSDITTATTTATIQHIAGTFDTNGKTINAGLFNCSNSITRSLILGTSTLNLSGVGVVFNCATVTGLTFSGASATVNVTDTSATTKTFEHRQAINKIGAVTFTGGSNASIIFGPSGYYGTLTFNPNTTYSINTAGTGLKIDTLIATGSVGNIITIISPTGGTPATITKSGGVVICDYLSLKDSAATGGATWYAGANSTNVSGNTGWVFSAPSGGRTLLGVGI